MAKAIKCDRCVEFHQRGSYLKIGVTTMDGGYIERRYDLCNQCLVDLVNFMKNAPVLNNIEEDDKNENVI